MTDAEQEITALRQQVAELTALGVSLHKAAAAGAQAERAAVVAYLRACDGESYDFADDIERGVHREPEEYAIGYNVWKEKS